MGRPIAKRFFGADRDLVQATATYDTDGAGDITVVAVTAGGSGYTESFSVTVEDGAESAILAFTVVAGVVTAGALTSQTGAFTFTQSDVVVSLPAPDATYPAFQILGSGWITGEVAAAPVYIIKQKSNRKFLCALASDPTKTSILKTVNSATPALGEISIAVEPFGGSTEYAKIIKGKKIQTFSNSYVWSDVVNAANVTGEADVGTDTPQ